MSEQELIHQAFENRQQLGVDNFPTDVGHVVERVLDRLERGQLRVAEPRPGGGWQVHDWIKKAVLLYFRMRPTAVMSAPVLSAFDKVPVRFGRAGEFDEVGARVVPGAIVRRGAHIGRDVVLMPSFVNIGAFVGAGTMVDTWATVGSCAQIGARVHLSGGVGIGGVLEPLQAAPTIIEDDCFIGARSEVVEGVIVGEGSVIAMGVFLGASTKIVNRTTGETHVGYVPPYSVVVSGTMPGKPIPGQNWAPSTYCAVIVKTVDAQTRAKTGINELLRD